MSKPRTETAPTTGSINGTRFSELETQLRHLLGEQQRLGELADRTREDLDRINAELFRFQAEYCTDAEREEEYDRVLERILGFDPRIDLKEVEEILAGKRSCEMKEFVEELERKVQAIPSPGVQ